MAMDTRYIDEKNWRDREPMQHYATLPGRGK